jgi:tetratricopeptide (TPR) repeat protein
VLRTALRLGALFAVAGCTAPAGPPRAAVEPTAQTQPSAAETFASALEREADPHAAVGRRDLAAPLYARAMELRAAGDARASDSRSLAELAVILHDRGDLEEAEHFYRRALAAGATDRSGDPDLRSRTLANLAWLLGERAAAAAGLGRASDAADLYHDALEIWETLQPASDALVAETLANLALLHRARGERDQARSLLERALPLYEKAFAADDPTVLRVRGLLADYDLRPNPPFKSSAPDPAAVARDLDREGAAYLDHREYARARPLLERAVAIHERGVTAPVELGASLSYLGRTYAGLGQRASARQTLQRSLALLEPALGKLDPLTLATRASLENVRAPAPADTP